MKITFQQLSDRLVAFVRRHCPTAIAICIISLNSIPSALFALGFDGGGNSGGSLTNSPPGNFPPGQCLLTDFEGLTQSGNGLIVFRRPNFSGSTASLLETAFADSSLVSSEKAHSGANSLKVRWQFRSEVSTPRWLRLTTFQSGGTAAVFPNPAIALSTRLSFWIYVPAGTPDFYLSAGLRETGSATTCGGNGGTAGAIEWVGATAVRGTTARAPLGKLISAKDQWVEVRFELPSEPVISFVSGNGVLNGAQGVFEHLAFTPVNEADLGPYTVYLDDIAFGQQSVGESEWKMTGAPVANWGAAACSADGSKLVAVVQNGPIYTSTDAGKTWTRTSAPTNFLWSAVASSADGSILAAASFPGPIYVSTNSGANWSPSGAPSSFHWASLACSADGSRIVAVPYQVPTFGGCEGNDCHNPGVYLSTDSGATWVARNVGGRPPFSRFWTSVACSADGTKFVASVLGWCCQTFPVMYGYLGTSPDSGTSWSLAAGGGTQWNWVASSADGSRLFAAGGPVAISTNAGLHWQLTAVPNGNWGSVACSADGTRIVASEYPGRIASSGDSGATWKLDGVANARWNGVAMSADGRTSVAVVYGGGIWISRPFPAILIQPDTLRVNEHDTATFSVMAESTAPLHYQWLLDGQPVSNQTNATLVLPQVQFDQRGAYAVTVSTAVGSVTSSNALLRVNRYPTADAGATPTLVISPNSTNATVFLNGSRSSDPDGDSLTYLWLSTANSQPSTPLTTGMLATVRLPVGTQLIALVVNDGLARSTNAIIIEIITTAEAVNRLEVALISEVSRAQPLAAILRAALASLDRGNPVSAINQLLAFQNKIRAQVEPIDPALATSLIQAAQEVVDALSGGHTNSAGRPHGRFTSMTRRSDGRMRMQFSPETGGTYLLEASTNLVDWELIGAVTQQTDGPFEFEDSHAARFGQRFYRVREL